MIVETKHITKTEVHLVEEEIAEMIADYLAKNNVLIDIDPHFIFDFNKTFQNDCDRWHLKVNLHKYKP